MSNKYKILIIGQFEHYMYEESVSDTLESLGHTVNKFSVKPYISNFFGKIEYYFTILGFNSLKMNLKIYKAILENKPDVILFWRCTLIFNFLLKRIKKKEPTIILTSYNNDDPFSSKYQKINQKRLWVNFKKNIPVFDINFVYRPQNLLDYNNFGSKNTKLLRPYYIENQIIKNIKTNKSIDVSFLGHPEPDRIELINHLLENNIDIKLFGEWDTKTLSNKLNQKRIRRANGSEYFEVLHNSKISIAFLSKLNRDVYTRRCFEIPAMGCFMLCERTAELQKFFKEGEEVDYFSTKEELLEKVRYYLNNPEILETISKNGQIRSMESGYEIKPTIHKYFLEPINNYLHSKEKTK